MGVFTSFTAVFSKWDNSYWKDNYVLSVYHCRGVAPSGEGWASNNNFAHPQKKEKIGKPCVFVHQQF